MVNEFNKIVAGMLASEGAVHLPQVGTLAVVRRPAERISSRRLRRSCNAVLFTEKVRGRSVVDAVAELCDSSQTEAQEIYERWLLKCCVDGVVAIDGVGHIERKRFFVDNEFDRLLNPNGHHVVELDRNGNSAVLKWTLLSIVLLLLAGGAVYWSGVYERRAEIASAVKSWFAHEERLAVVGPAVAEQTAEQEEIAAVEPAVGINGTDDESGVPSAEQTAVAAEEVATTVTSPEPEEKSEPAQEAVPESAAVRPAVVAEPIDGVGRLTSGWSYVVYGVFSTPENAMRAVTELRGRGVSGCSAFAYGPKYMVALYFSASPADCTAFIRGAKEFENLWVYTAH